MKAICALVATVLAALCAVSAELAFFLPRPSADVNVILDGVTTSITPVAIDLSNLISAGSLDIGNVQVNLTMAAPVYKYISQEIGRYPAQVFVVGAVACLVGDTNRYNLSLNTAQTAFAATPDPLTRKLLTLGDFVANLFHLPGLDQLEGQITQLGDAVNRNANATVQIGLGLHTLQNQYNDLLGNQSALNQGLVKVNQLLTDSQARQAKVDEGLLNLVVQNRDQISILSANENSLASGVSVLANQTQVGFATVQTNLINLQSSVLSDIQIAFNAATSQQQASTAYLVGVMNTQFAQVYNITQQNVIRTDAEFLKSNTLIQKSLDTTNSLAQLVWLYIHKQQLRRIVTTQFFQQNAAIPAGFAALVSTGGIAPIPGGVSGVDLRTVEQGVYINYVASVSGVNGAFAQITSARVELLADALESLDTAQGLIDEQYIAKHMGPANCTRAFIGLDHLGNPIPEDPLYANSSSACAFWFEVVIQTCAAASSSFSWRTSVAGLDETQVPNTIQTSFCASGVVTTLPTIVFRRFEDYLAWYAQVTCTASLWSGSLPEFQVTETLQLPAERAYVQQNVSACYGNIPTQNSYYPPGVFAFQWMWIRDMIPRFVLDVFSTELKQYGRLPNGVHYDYTPLMYTPVTFDGNGDAIFDGGADPMDCILATWRWVSEATVSVNAITPKTGDYLSGEVQVSSFAYQPGVVPDYIDTTITQELTITVDATPILPGNAMYFGNPWVDSTITDAPQRLMESSNQKDAVKNTFGALLMPAGTTTTLTFEQYQAVKGPWFQAGDDTALTIESFTVARGNTANGNPYCVTTGGLPQNGTNGQFGPKISPDPAPNGWLCLVFKFFGSQLLFRQGQFELQLSPYTWKATAILNAFSGQVATRINSRCSVATLNPLGDQNFFVPGEDGIELVFSNTLNIPNQMEYTIAAVNASQADLCNVQKGVTVQPSPPFPLTVVGIPSGCTQFVVTINRLAVDITNNNAIVPVLCQTITASAVLQTIQSYSGIPTQTSIVINTAVDGVSNRLSNLVSSIGLISVQNALFSLQISGGDAVSAKNSFQPIIDVFSQNATALQLSSINFGLVNITTNTLAQVAADAQAENQLNIQLVKNSTAVIAGIQDNIDGIKADVAAAQVQNIENQRIADVISNNITKVELLNLAILDGLGVHLKPIDYPSFGDFLNAVGDALSGGAGILIDVAKAASKAAFSIAGGLSGILGGLGDFFSSGFGIMGMIIPLIMICVGVPIVLCICNQIGPIAQIMGLSGKGGIGLSGLGGPGPITIKGGGPGGDYTLLAHTEGIRLV